MIELLVDILQDNNPFFIITAGLMLGLIHAFEPDHISAISTQLLQKNISKNLYLRNLTVTTSLKGLFWGMGHTSSIIIICLFIVGLSLNIPENFFIGAEIIVGVMLIILGIFTFTNKSIFKHVHPHTHSNGIDHTHSHTHDTNHTHNHKSYLIGCVHGIAGSGALVALVASVNGFDMMLYFLILFGIGSILGMITASGILGLPIILLSKINLTTKYLRYAIASITFIIGINIIITIGMDSKLFSLN